MFCVDSCPGIEFNQLRVLLLRKLRKFSHPKWYGFHRVGENIHNTRFTELDFESNFEA